MKTKQIASSDPVIIRKVGHNFVVLNESGDWLNKPTSFNACKDWCLKNSCQAVKNFKTLERI